MGRGLEFYGGENVERDVRGAVVEYGELCVVAPIVFGEAEDMLLKLKENL